MIIIAGLFFPENIRIPFYEFQTPSGTQLVRSETWEDNETLIQLDILRFSDADSDHDYYFIVYCLNDIRFGNDSMTCPAFVRVQLNFSTSNQSTHAPEPILSFRSPDPGWLVSGFLGLGAGRITFDASNDGSSISKVKWDISGTGGLPLLVHVMNRKLVVTIGIRVQEGDNFTVSAQSNVVWFHINRYLGLIGYMGEESSPVANLTSL
ncbi:MAG: hypothetical protein ACXABV_04250 [Candidatus Thorarchaeota archaeon]